MSLKPPVLCLVTDRMRLVRAGRSDPGPLLELIAAAADTGCDLVQIREADLGDRALGRLVERAVDCTRPTRTRIVVNDRVDVALAHGADGVHLKSGSVPAARLRPHVPGDWIVGRSIHSPDEGARAAAAGGLDYVLLGPVFRTASKPGRRPLGTAALRRAAAALPVPVLGIGGVTTDNVRLVAGSGAAGAAAIGLFAALAGEAHEDFRRVVDTIRALWTAG